MKIFIDVFCGMRYQQLFPLAKKVGFNGFFSGELYANDANEPNATKVSIFAAFFTKPLKPDIKNFLFITITGMVMSIWINFANFKRFVRNVLCAYATT